MIRKYLKEIIDIAKTDDFTELTYYSSVENLIKEYTKTKNIEITVIPVPKKTEVGYPDFKILSGVSKFIGCIEAKSPTCDNLDYIANNEQLKKYRGTFPNLILTNFYEFRLYRNGTQICKTQITFPPLDIQTPAALRKEKEFCDLLDKFLAFSIPKITTSEKLAEELAKRTRFLKEDIMNVDEIKNDNNIKGFYNAFKEYLIPDLDDEQFADLFSQTITYSLFASRTRIKDRDSDKFSRKLAYENIPHRTLRDIFRYISQEKIPEQLSCIIGDIIEVLAITPVNRIFTKHTQLSLGEEFLQEEREKDPIYHFYEPFLAKYNPKERKRRGVYYTPLPVVSYIVRSLNIILKEKFNKSSGFADKEVTVLDPAAGTLTFLIETIKLAINEFINKYGEGDRLIFIKDHILKNFYAFELMMAPYAVGHLKMLFVLRELGYELKDDGVKFYLTNTLEPEVRELTTIPGIGRTLSEEAGEANKVKKATPILVILSNPPYKAISANASDKYIYKNGKRKKIKTWIGELIEDYKYVDEKPLKEKNPKLLQDDYVKFIRWAQWKIEQLREGVIGFITNHGYLDNVTFRGLRQSLMNSFNEIYVVNLHGSVRKGGAPDDSKDENVFNIQQGVAISLFIKNRSKEKCKVYYYDVWGKKEDKYKWLNNNDKNTTNWDELEPHSPNYFFVPKKEKYYKEYQKYPSIKDIFEMNSVGITTGKDDFVIDFDEKVLKNRIMMFRNLSKSDEEIRVTYKLKDTSDFNLKEAREKLAKDKNWDKHFKEILYRTFDKRYIYYNKILISRPRFKIMQHIMKENLALISCRQLSKTGFYHAFVCENIVESCAISDKTREGNYIFPLYVYPEDIFNNEQAKEKRRPNIDSKITDRLNKSYKKKLLPEQIFYYIYGILYSNTYREKYDEFLNYDFPRIPFTNDYEAFSKISKLGKRLVNLHLLKPEEIFSPVPIVKFEGEGGNSRIEKIEFRENRVEINEIKYFDKVLKNMWEYQIGGYQVLEKWLKERKDRILSLDESCHYSECGTAIARTIQIQKEIDKIYPKAEKGIIDF